MADNLLVVSAEGPEARVGVVENGRLAEYFLERKRERGIVGNIYKGKVQRVLPGMQAAFVKLDPAVEKAAFLYVGDVPGAIDDPGALFDDDVEPGDLGGGRRRRQQPERRIEDVLKERQEVLVQVVKDPMGVKGARITGYVSLPGRYLVFMPGVDQVGVSRRISSDKERKRVRKVVEEAKPKGCGFIVRTAAEGAADQEIADDVDFLVKLWKEIGRRQEQLKAPSLLYADLDLVLRCIRDRLTDDMKSVFIDSELEYERVRKFVSAFMPRWLDRIKLYQGRRGIFDHFGLEAALRQALERKVPLESGGAIVIDQGEALTAIDVNTGKFVGKKNLEETLTRNNLEACEVVANQIRLRNLGGIIVIDFVDMEKESNRKKVFEAFLKALERDTARTNVVKISELGLVEMTRKRTRESLTELVTEACPCCAGRGRVKTAQSVAYEILHEVRRVGGSLGGDVISVTCAPPVAEVLRSQEREYVDELEKRFHKKVEIHPQRDIDRETFSVTGRGKAGAEPGTPPGGTPGSGKKRGRRGGRNRKRKSNGTAPAAGPAPAGEEVDDGQA